MKILDNNFGNMPNNFNGGYGGGNFGGQNFQSMHSILSLEF